MLIIIFGFNNQIVTKAEYNSVRSFIPSAFHHRFLWLTDYRE
jgi:hypothetical protein